MQNTQYHRALCVHKQPCVFNTTYTIRSRVNCPSVEQNRVTQELKIKDVDTRVLLALAEWGGQC